MNFQEKVQNIILNPQIIKTDPLAFMFWQINKKHIQDSVIAFITTKLQKAMSYDKMVNIFYEIMKYSILDIDYISCVLDAIDFDKVSRMMEFAILMKDLEIIELLRDDYGFVFNKELTLGALNAFDPVLFNEFSYEAIYKDEIYSINASLIPRPNSIEVGGIYYYSSDPMRPYMTIYHHNGLNYPKLF